MDNVIGDLVPLKYPGYFWKPDENAVYSGKIGVKLKKLTMKIASSFNNFNDSFVVMSEGKRIVLTVASLKREYRG